MDKSHVDTTAAFDQSRQATLTLKDSLGKVSFVIPVRYDTSFSWTKHSDCGKPCDQEQYRFQPKTLPVFKERGFYYDMPDITIDQFTIIHSGYFPFYDGTPDTSKNFARHTHFKERLSANPYNGQVIFDTIEKIGDRYYSIVYMQNNDTTKKKYSEKLAALTTIRGNEVEFYYDATSKDRINSKRFFDNSVRFIRTIRISNGI